MKKTSWMTHGLDICYLCACALQGEAPDPKRVAVMDLAQVFTLSQHHLLTAMTYMALERCPGSIPDPKLLASWKEASGMAIRKNLMLSAKRQEICSILEQKGIWYAPLKGSVLQSLYPKTGMRQMKDVDILFDPGHRAEVRDVMVALGFKVKEFEVTKHDLYEKKPLYSFELHVELFSPEEAPREAAYYQDIATRLIPAQEGTFARQLRPEDLYVYMISHDHHHEDASGSGIRALLDIHLMLSHWGSALDWTDIQNQLQILGLQDFERSARSLAQKLFTIPMGTLTKDEQTLFRSRAISGTHGTKLQAGQRKLEQDSGSKAHYLFRRIFLTDAQLRVASPFFYRHKLLRPFYGIWRLLTKGLRNFRELWAELMLVLKFKKDT